jgi:outer membrane murein-binding lipoprotein Lpp
MPFNIEKTINDLVQLDWHPKEGKLDEIIEELKQVNAQVAKLQHDYDTLLQKVYADQKPIAALLRAKEKS